MTLWSTLFGTKRWVTEDQPAWRRQCFFFFLNQPCYSRKRDWVKKSSRPDGEMFSSFVYIWHSAVVLEMQRQVCSITSCYSHSHYTTWHFMTFGETNKKANWLPDSTSPTSVVSQLFPRTSLLWSSAASQQPWLVQDKQQVHCWLIQFQPRFRMSHQCSSVVNGGSIMMKMRELIFLVFAIMMLTPTQGKMT